MTLPRPLWAKAPFVLLRHPAVLLGVAAAAFLVATAAASAPLLRAGAESAALETRLHELTPLAAGLTIETRPNSVRDPERTDRTRRAAAARLARTLPYVGDAILTSSSFAAVAGTSAAGHEPLYVVPMARTNATQHVKVLQGEPGAGGVWIAASAAQVARVHPGGAIELLSQDARTHTSHKARLRVRAVYRQLDADLANPYWVNFVVRIRSPAVDPPPLPTFLLMSDRELYRLGDELRAPGYENVFELPVTGKMNPARARQVDEAFDRVRRELAHDTPLARSLGCGTSQLTRCHVSTSLTSAMVLAAQSVAALEPVISLLAAFAGLIAVGAAIVAGAFGVRRRASEARLSVVGGECRVAFGSRSALEVALPVLLGAGAGFLFATVLVRTLTPTGTVDGAVFRHAALASGGGALLALAAVTAGAVAARGPSVRRAVHARRKVWVPWEVAPLVAAAVVFVVVERGSGLVRNATAGAHPRLFVLCLPLLVAAGASGLAVRAGRRVVALPRATGVVVYLALRRLAAARALLVMLVVTAAVSCAALTFAEVLGDSLASNSVAKAYVANGSDVQGLIDPLQPLPQSFPFPIAKVIEGFDVGFLDNGDPVDLLAVDPARLRTVVRSPALDRLRESAAPLPAIADSRAAGTTSLWVAGKRIPVRVVATVRSFPGMIAGDALLVLPQAKLERAVRAANAIDPLENANAYVWARGDPADVQAALARSPLEPSFVTTVHHFLDNADLGTAERTYGFLRVVGFGAAAIALIALLLYLHARARSQLVTGALLARMGMTQGRQAASVAVEAALLVAFSGAIGAASALLCAKPLVTRVDPLAQYAPAAVVSVPWALLLASLAVVVAVAAAAGALASVGAARADVGEALRVA
jgi:putative ABC transport system permease protein